MNLLDCEIGDRFVYTTGRPRSIDSVVTVSRVLVKHIEVKNKNGTVFKIKKESGYAIGSGFYLGRIKCVVTPEELMRIDDETRINKLVYFETKMFSQLTKIAAIQLEKIVFNPESYISGENKNV